MKLSIAQMTRMSQLLEESLPLDAQGRRRWLRALTPVDAELAAALQRALLPEPGDVAAFEALADLPRVAVAEADPEFSDSGLVSGARVGPYELIRRLGTGGMAEVWLARRADGAFRRDVALKLPRLSRLRGDLAQRFVRERDILASLEHPNIARLYDAGVDPQGLSYLAMEYVQGRPLTVWCDAHGLRIGPRLELFLQVLEAVQYAHDKNVIHRDLKPSNILVTESGQVRLLDFGVAKLLDSDAPDQTQLTNVYGRALTPDYASAEQLRGDPVDVRSDVYSLGVLLYELLTGVRPHRLMGAAAAGLLEHALATVEVTKPSTRHDEHALTARGTSADQLTRQLRGDLDAIVLHSLSNDPADRYASVAALGDDLRRYLAGKPIRVLPVRLTDLARKFVRRNRIVVGITASMTLVLAFVVGYSGQRQRTASSTSATHGTAPVTEAIEQKSIAVLPFVDMSAKHDQEYFSDGLAEELLNSLAKVHDLRVAARTSSFSFKGEKAEVADIARKLKVGTLLEGSVRKDGARVRIAAQLVNAATGFNIWSQTYDRELTNVLALQTEIATAVTGALQATLLPGTAAAIELGRTRSPAAYDAYLRGKSLARGPLNRVSLQARIDAFGAAIRLDPSYAKAYIGYSTGLSSLAAGNSSPEEQLALARQAGAAAQRAIELAPDLAESHDALAYWFENSIDFAAALLEYERALQLSPDDPEILRGSGHFLIKIGRTSRGMTNLRRSLELDPLNGAAYRAVARTLLFAGDDSLATTYNDHALALNPTDGRALANRGLMSLARGDFQGAIADCSLANPDWFSHTCLAMAYDKAQQRAAADAELAAINAAVGDSAAYQYAEIYAQRGDVSKALEWLATAYRLRDSGLSQMQVDRWIEPLRREPRFLAIVRKMNFPA